MFYSKPEEKKVEKVKYSEVKKCLFKKEMGEHTEECKELFKKLNIDD